MMGKVLLSVIQLCETTVKNVCVKKWGWGSDRI